MKGRRRRSIGCSRASAYTLSAMLAIAIVVSLSALVYYWSLSSTSGEFAPSILDEALRSEERFEIHEVAFDRNLTEVGFDGKGLVVYLANDGSVSVKLVGMYVNGENVTMMPSSVTLGPKEVEAVYAPYDWSEGESYEVKVVSSRGNHRSSRFLATSVRIVD
ncbi:MAG: hypothetical protein J7K45_00805 [Thaumarchaeota archaeon]|nr:hypothetical protein [Nitrososphaerota archaeon]